MAATVVSFPPTPAAVYRPMQLQVQRNDPSGSAIDWIKVADATDVTTHGNGLEVGQVFIRHALIQGDVTLQAGQTLNIYQNGGAYLRDNETIYPELTASSGSAPRIDAENSKNVGGLSFRRAYSQEQYRG